MPSPQDIQCHTILRAATSAELGLVLRTNDPYRARASLYKARKDIGDIELAALQIRTSPDDPEHELWIIKRSEAPILSLEEI